MLGEGGVEHSNAINTIIADSTFFFTGGEDGQVLVWELQTDKLVRTLSLSPAPVRSLLRHGEELWVGLSNGYLQVLQIYGEAIDGVDSELHSTPHNAPITQMVTVGEQEVWSISHHDPDNADEKINCIAVWDVRAMTYHLSTSFSHNYVNSVVVLDRTPLEAVSVVVIDGSFKAETITQTVTGRINEEEDTEHSDSQDSQGTNPPLLQEDINPNNTEMPHFLHLDRKKQGNPRSFRRSSLIFSPAASPLHTATTVTLPQSISEDSQAPRFAATGPEQRRRSLPLPVSQTDSNAENPQLSILDHVEVAEAPTGNKHRSVLSSTPVMEALEISLGRVVDLLVGLMTENIYTTSHDEGHTKNEALRTAVANITKEINVGRQLMSCAGTNPASPSMISAVPSLPTLPAESESSYCENTDVYGKKIIGKETESFRALEKNLSVVMRERDLLAVDVQQSQTQYDLDMSSLQSLLRENADQIKAKDIELQDLREQCNVFRTRYEEEVKRRNEQEDMFREQTEKLSVLGQKASKSFEEELVIAHGKIKTLSDEAESRQESLRMAETQIEELTKSCENLLVKCEALTEEQAETAAKEKESQERCEEKIVEQNTVHQNELQALQTKHCEDIAHLENKCDGLSSDVEDWKRQMAAQREEHANLIEKEKAEKAEIESSLHAVIEARSSQAADDINYQELLSKQGEAMAELKKSHANSKVREQTLHDENEAQKRRIEELKEEKENLDSQLQEKVGKILDLQEKVQVYADDKTALSEELSQLAEEKKTLEQELEHRRSANKLHEAELNARESETANLHSALEEIRDELASSEAEISDLKEKLEIASSHEVEQTRHISELEERIKATKNMTQEAAIAGSTSAIRALLASANGEIEQLTSQLDAMHRAHAAQEAELNELRESVSFRDEVIRRKNISIGAPQRQPISNAEEDKQRTQGIDSGFTANNGNKQNSGIALSVSSTPEKLQTSAKKKQYSIISRDAELYVNEALETAQREMVRTKEKLKEITSIARQYKEAAQAHRDALPVLVELEGELLRVARRDVRKASVLKSARGVVQSMIAQYFSDSDKVTVIERYDENIYAASPERQTALEDTVARMRLLRTGRDDGPFPTRYSPNSSSDTPLFSREPATTTSPTAPDDRPTPRRYLSF